ncbi:hypothetical protein [Streptomyces sp. NPDC048603]|uniref:hypothetical protein n=1 Tax=Streptomyces sp. NPDC048603 TaxID=3365577 RepID=UPI0037133A71
MLRPDYGLGNGWLEVQRRAGYQGRNVIIPRRSVLEAAAERPEGEEPPHGGEVFEAAEVAEALAAGADERTSGSANQRTSLANKELQPSVDVQEKKPPNLFCGSGRRASSGGGRARGGPTVSVVAHRVLHGLPVALTPGQYRLAAGVVERAVAEAGGDPERIRDRILRRLAEEWGRPIRSAYGWLVGRGLRNDPCPDPACEEGALWPDGSECRICHERWIDRRGTPLVFRNRARPIYDVRWFCSACERPGTGEPPERGVCRCCREERAAGAAGVADPATARDPVFADRVAWLRQLGDVGRERRAESCPRPL